MSQKSIRQKNYAYNGKSAQAEFHIEFSKDKGCREYYRVFNDRKQAYNKPYRGGRHAALAYHYEDEQTGRIHCRYLEFMTYEDINDHCVFIAQHFEALGLTNDMLIKLYAHIWSAIRILPQFTTADSAKLRELLTPAEKIVLQGFKTGENVFAEVKIDLNAINQLKEEAKS